MLEVNQMTEVPASAKIWQGYDYDKQMWIFNGKPDTRTLAELQTV